MTVKVSSVCEGFSYYKIVSSDFKEFYVILSLYKFKRFSRKVQEQINSLNTNVAIV